MKIAPDLADEDVDAVADLALELGLDGIIATNTTIGRGRASSEHRDRRPVRPSAEGPLAGGAAPTARPGRATAWCSSPSAASRTCDDVWERLLAGATLVQGYTAMIYEGPLWAIASTAPWPAASAGTAATGVREIIGRTAS